MSISADIHVQHSYGPCYCQNCVSAQYLVNELMEFDQNLLMDRSLPDLGLDCYTSFLADLQ